MTAEKRNGLAWRGWLVGPELLVVAGQDSAIFAKRDLNTFFTDSVSERVHRKVSGSETWRLTQKTCYASRGGRVEEMTLSKRDWVSNQTLWKNILGLLSKS